MVCKSEDPRDNRLRTSILIEHDDATIVVDVGPDFRQQMLSNPIAKLDAILLTHEHNDHVIGMDDIRPFYFRQRSGIEFYATSKVFDEIKTRFPYVFQKNPYPGAPQITMNAIDPLQPFEVNGLQILPIRVLHGKLPVLGFRINDFAYITDASFIPGESLEALRGVQHIIVNALRREKHYSHFNLEEALDFIAEVKPKHAYLTHISHLMGTTHDLERELPAGVNVGYDNLSIEVK